MYQSLKLQDCGCRPRACPHCGSGDFHKHGFFYRQDDARRIRRYRCQSCGKTFSGAGFSLFYRHRHRRLNKRIHAQLVHGGTLRGMAKQLKLDKDTVARRLPLLADLARQREQLRLAAAPLANTVQFEELITFEHTKMKPLSVSVISDADRWRLLGFAVSRIPASGHVPRAHQSFVQTQLEYDQTGRTSCRSYGVICGLLQPLLPASLRTQVLRRTR